jgi:hypothetical protein
VPLQETKAALGQAGIPALQFEQGENRLRGIDQKLQIGYPFGSLHQQLHRAFDIAAAGGQHAAVVEFDDFLADLREQRLPVASLPVLA